MKKLVLAVLLTFCVLCSAFTMGTSDFYSIVVDERFAFFEEDYLTKSLITEIVPVSDTMIKVMFVPFYDSDDEERPFQITHYYSIGDRIRFKKVKGGVCTLTIASFSFNKINFEK